ncbi:MULTISPECIES: thioredoxin family protein [Flavobacterium]|uniref:Thioredoxin family protein n=1 Tax=Flavobacterium jumunjinense TaxID=998845 RepID=A0ABV5GU17_9FLAO|nr:MULTISPECIES: thioredoxin family protein [Flavobacterium]
MIEINNEDELYRVVQEHEIVVLFFSASWCIPCKKMKKLLDKISSEESLKIQVANIDIEKYVNLTLSNNINVIPMVHYYKNGNVFLKESGLKTHSYVFQNIEALIKVVSI